MSGAIPPSIVTFSYKVDLTNTGNEYVNISFPFVCRIEQMWFTVDGTALDGGDWTSGRKLRLGALKSKNAKYAGGFGNTDWAFVFGPYDGDSDTKKPTIFLGDPGLDDDDDGSPQNENYNPLTTAFRSSAKTPFDQTTVPVDQAYWWLSGDYPEGAVVRSDLGRMNTDEFLSVFVYNDEGDWGGYSATSLVTIYVQYTAIADSMALPVNPRRFWD